MFFTIFLYIFENPRRKNLLTLPVPSILKWLNEIKNDINVYFYASLWCLKRFYEGLRTFLRHQKCVDVKKYVIFSLICLCPYCRTPDLCHFLSLTIKIHKNRTWSVKNKPNLLAHDSYLFLAPNFGIFLIIVALQYAPKYIQNPLRRF